MKLKSITNAATVGLALATAYGLGVISCVVYEVKLFADVVEKVNKEDTNVRNNKKHRVSYTDMYKD